MLDFKKMKAIVNRLHTGEGKTFTMCKYIIENDYKTLIIVPNISNVVDVIKTLIEVKKENISFNQIGLISEFLYKNKIHIPDSICGKYKLENPFIDKQEELLKLLNDEDAHNYLKKKYTSYPLKEAKITIISQYNLGFMIYSKYNKNKNVLDYIDYIQSCDNIFIDELDSNLGVISCFYFTNSAILISRKVKNEDFKEFDINNFNYFSIEELKEQLSNHKYFTIDDKLFMFNIYIKIEGDNFKKEKKEIENCFLEPISIDIYKFDSLRNMYEKLVINNIIEFEDIDRIDLNNIISIKSIKKIDDIEGCSYYYDYDNLEDITDHNKDNLKQEIIKRGYRTIKFDSFDKLVENQHKIIGLSATIDGEYDSDISDYFDKNSIKQNIKYNYVNVDLNTKYRIESLDDFLNFKDESILFITPTLTKKNYYSKLFGNNLSNKQKINYLTNSELIGSNDLKDFEMFYFLGFEKDQLIVPYIKNDFVAGEYSLKQYNEYMYKHKTIRSFDREQHLEFLKKPIFKKYIIQTLGRMNRGIIKEKFIFYPNCLSKIINIHKLKFKE